MRGYNIESGLNNTFKKVDNTVNQMAGKMGGGMGLGKQVDERPWLMVGAALALGYVVGTFVGGNDDDDYEDNRRSRRQHARSNNYASRYSDIGEHASGRSSTNYTSPTSVGDKQSVPASSTHSSHTGTHTGHASSYSYEGSSYRPEYSAPKASSMPSAPNTPNTSNTPHTSSKSQQSGQQGGVQNAISSMFGEQLDTATATATSAVRSFLRDTIRDAVPSMRDQVDALDRRDGVSPSSSTSSASTTPRDIDTRL